MRHSAPLASCLLLLVTAGCAPQSRAPADAEAEPDAPEVGASFVPDAAPDVAADLARDTRVAADLTVDAGVDGGGADAVVGTDTGMASALVDAAVDLAREAAAPDAVRFDTAAPGTWVGPPLVVGVGNDGRRIVSADGVAWTGDVRDVTGNRDGPMVLRALAYGNKTVVAVGGACGVDCTSRIMTFDGKTWTEVTTPAGAGRLNGVAFGDGLFVAVGASGPVLYSADNGRSWQPTGLAGMMTGLRAVAHGRVGGTNMFVAVGDGYSRVRSVDGVRWTDHVPSNGAADGFRAVAMANNVVVAVGGRTDMGRRIRSADGVTWTDDVVGGPEVNALVVVDNRFHAFTSSGDTTLYTSMDGKAWTTATTINPGSNVAGGMLGAMRLFVSRTSPATIKTSTDGINWTTRLMSATGDATLHAFVFAGS